MRHSLDQYSWINPPKKTIISEETLKFKTIPETDFWQRTYYGFQNDNGHIFAFNTTEREFSYSVFSEFVPNKLFDQSGIILYQDSENWFKASVEFHDEKFSRLGSVVTNLGYSDWATTDIASQDTIRMHYRLSRREKDFLIENSFDGEVFQQMRIFHMHSIQNKVQIGFYACSPLTSSLWAEFSSIKFGKCLWELHKSPE